ncbi:hypothetical protein NG99_03025 [Erwinia typographi]|uniref:ImpA N-terminal domain-containing protein n=2 Tax=Erwinia typographi TaxID=371042 RepID=A0A0A4ACF3_9GAMM|nr:hypothetical protein NG99_03025 [Erwinia typographi]
MPQSGADPRRLADYAALQHEITKLSHSHGPQPDWSRVSSLSVSLLAHGEPDLQVTAWYTLARTHLAGPAGMNEGLVMLKVLLACQWDICQPVSLTAKLAVLTSLVSQLQRALSGNEPCMSVRPLLHRAGWHAAALDGLLLRRMHQQAAGPFAPLRHTLQTLCGVTPRRAVRWSAPSRSEPDRRAVRVAAARRWLVRMRPRPGAGLLMLMSGALVLWGASTLRGISLAPGSPVWPDTPAQTAPSWPEDNDGWMYLVNGVSDGTVSPDSRPVEVLWPDSPDTVVAGWQQGLAPLQALSVRLNAPEASQGKAPSADEMRLPVYAALQSLYRVAPPEIRPRVKALPVPDKAVYGTRLTTAPLRRTGGGR